MTQVNSEKLCRICVKESYFFSNIFNEQLDDGNLFVDIVNDLLQLDVEFEDGYPQFLCSECYKKISEFQLFKRSAHEGRAILLYSNESIENNGIKLEGESTDVGRFVQNEVYLVSVKTEDDYSAPVDRDPLQVEMLNEAEERFRLDEDASDNEHGCDIKGSNMRMHSAESGDELESEGVVKTDDEHGVWMDDLWIDEGQNRFCNGDVVLNMAVNDENDFPLQRSSKFLRVPLPSDNHDNKTQAVKQGRNEGSTSKVVGASTSSCNKRINGNGDVRDDDEDDISLNAYVKCVYTEGVVKGDGSNVEFRKSNEREIVGKYGIMCRQLQCDDLLINRSKMHFRAIDNGSKLGRDNVPVPVRTLLSRKSEEDERVDQKRLYECNFCNKMFSHKQKLVVHRRLHTGESTFKCSSCDKAFSCSSRLIVHERVHSGEKPFKCNSCDKRFSQIGSMRQHELLHTGEKRFKCDLCEKTFSQRSSLTTHERVHTGEKPYKCDLCAKEFSHSSHLRDHKRVHTGEKPYKCVLCGRAFSKNSALTLHERVHTGEKPFQCYLCNKMFSQSSTLRKHERAHNSPVKPLN